MSPSKDPRALGVVLSEEMGVASRNLFDLLPLGIVVTNDDDKIVEANGVAARLLGLSQPGQSLAGLAIATESLLKADGSPLPYSEHPSVRARREKRVLVDEQIGNSTAEGDTVWFQVTATPLPGIGVLTTYYDVTNSRQAEDDLRHHIEQLDAFFETNLDLLAILNSEGRAVRLNPAWGKLLGHEPDQLAGARILDFVHPSDMEATLGSLARLRTDREVVGFVSRVHAQGGAYRFLEWRATARDDLIYATARDITDQRLAEAALRESEARYRAIFEQAAVGVAEVDAETGRFIRINQRFCEIVGYSQEEMLTLNFQGLTHPDDLPTDVGFFHRCRAGEITEFSREKRYIHKDGRIVWINLQVKVPSAYPASRRTFVTVIEDITERRETDELLRKTLADVLEANQRLNFQITRMPLAYIAWNKEFRVVEWNASAERIFGWSAAEATGRHAYDLLVPPEARPQMAKLWQSILEGGEEGSQYTEENFTRDGRRIDCEWFNAPWIDARGQIVGCLSMVHDITERLRVEEKLLRSQRMEGLGSFAAGIAHDMNSVLRTILRTAKSMEGGVLDRERLSAGLEDIVRACTRGRTLLRGLLDFARQDVPEAKVIDINEIIQEQLQLLDRSLPAGVNVEKELAPRLPTIAGDPNALASAFMHLLSNAIDAMPRGGVLTVRTRLQEAGNVEIDVEDTGCGMSKDVLGRALDPFFTTKPHGKGAGLGLPAVYGAVKAHQGHLELHSEPGRGTQVHIILPLAPTPGANIAHLRDQPNNLQGLRILLVDDDDLVQTAVSAQLRRLGHSIVMAENGREAVDKVQAGLQIDLVLLDMDMPVLDGSKALPLLRKLRPDLPVVIETGNLGDKAEELVRNHRDVTVLVRPFSLTELKAALDPWIARVNAARSGSASDPK
jgi:two-component system, cell cycle sensor histidine kinase and response regulator CckA